MQVKLFWTLKASFNLLKSVVLEVQKWKWVILFDHIHASPLKTEVWVKNYLFLYILSIFQKALSRKGSYRQDRRNGEEQEVDEALKKLVVKGVRHVWSL